MANDGRPPPAAREIRRNDDDRDLDDVYNALNSFLQKDFPVQEIIDTGNKKGYIEVPSVRRLALAHCPIAKLGQALALLFRLVRCTNTGSRAFLHWGYYYEVSASRLIVSIDVAMIPEGYQMLLKIKPGRYVMCSPLV